MSRLPALRWLLPLFAFAVTGCGEDATTATDDDEAAGSGGAGAVGSASGGPTTSASTTGSGAGGPVCDTPDPPHLDDSDPVDSITATYIDQFDTLAAGVQTTVCGTNVCSTPVDSGSDGTVVVAAATFDFQNPRFNASHDAQEFAKLSALIPESPTYAFGQVRVIRMPTFAEGVAIVAGQEVTQGGVTLDVPAGASIKHDTLTYLEESTRVLRGAVLDVTEYPASEFPVLDPSLDIEVLVAVMPLGTGICPGAGLSFDNVRLWTPGTEVNIYLNGAKTFEHYAPYGQWALVAEGEVSPDGSQVVTKAGEVVESLGTFGVALK